MRSTSEHNEQRTGSLEKMITWAAAFCMGVAAAFLASLKQVNPTIEFAFSTGTVAGFVLAAVFTLVCFRIILERGGAGPTASALQAKRRRRWLLLFALVASAAMLVSFTVALQNLSPGKRAEVLSGTSIAAVVLALFGWMFWRVTRFFDPPEKPPES